MYRKENYKSLCLMINNDKGTNLFTDRLTSVINNKITHLLFFLNPSSLISNSKAIATVVTIKNDVSQTLSPLTPRVSKLQELLNVTNPDGQTLNLKFTCVKRAK